jgi:hypothetical protein
VKARNKSAADIPVCPEAAHGWRTLPPGTSGSSVPATRSLQTRFGARGLRGSLGSAWMENVTAGDVGLQRSGHPFAPDALWSPRSPRFIGGRMDGERYRQGRRAPAFRLCAFTFAATAQSPVPPANTLVPPFSCRTASLCRSGGRGGPVQAARQSGAVKFFEHATTSDLDPDFDEPGEAPADPEAAPVVPQTAPAAPEATPAAPQAAGCGST